MSEEKESNLLRWTAPEFVKYKRGWKWYLATAAVYLAVGGYSIYARDWFILAVSTIILGVSLAYTQREPKETEYKITQLGLYVNGLFYPYNELHSFWTILNSDQKVLNIAFRKKYLPALTALFYGVDPLELKTTLSKYLPEQEDRMESLIEKLQRYLRLN